MTSKVSLDKKRKFHPLLHEILWTARRYWWVALVGFLLFFAFTFVATSLEGNRPDEFALIMRDSEVALRIAGVVYGLFASFVLFSFLWSRRESITYLSVSGKVLSFVCETSIGEVETTLRAHGGLCLFETYPMSLEEVFKYEMKKGGKSYDVEGLFGQKA